MRANHFLVRHIDSIVYLCVFASILFRAASSSRQFARGLGWWTVLGGTAMNIHEHSHLATCRTVDCVSRIITVAEYSLQFFFHLIFMNIFMRARGGI